MRLHDLMRESFLISPPRPTRRSPTGKRSICEIPEAPVTSDDQNASTSCPTGVTTPAAAMAMRSAGRATITNVSSAGCTPPHPEPVS